MGGAMSSSGGASPPDQPTPPGGNSDSPPAVSAPVPPVGAPIPASLLGPGAPLSAALGEVGLGVGAPGEDEADMGRLQAMLEARGFPPHLAGSCKVFRVKLLEFMFFLNVIISRNCFRILL